MAEQIAESAFSGVGQVADETRRTREVAEAAIAEARSMHGAVESRVAALSARADESTTHAVEVLTEQMRQTAAETEAKASQYCWNRLSAVREGNYSSCNERCRDS